MICSINVEIVKYLHVPLSNDNEHLVAFAYCKSNVIYLCKMISPIYIIGDSTTAYLARRHKGKFLRRGFILASVSGSGLTGRNNFVAQLRSIPDNSVVVIVGGWNDSNAEDYEIVCAMRELMSVAQEKKIRFLYRCSLEPSGLIDKWYYNQLYYSLERWTELNNLWRGIFDKGTGVRVWEDFVQTYYYGNVFMHGEDVHHRVWGKRLIRHLKQLCLSLI
jgi:hypothetical protein